VSREHGSGTPAWQGATRATPGSWWPHWRDFLDAHSGAPLAPPAMGAPGQDLPSLAPAPGTYVKAK
jgi:polyhydroxyalkanoate synthase